MQLDSAVMKNLISRDFMDLLIRFGLVVLVLTLCIRIFAPFAGLMIWALVLAVALYPLQQGLARRLGGREGLAATLLVLLFVLLLFVPTVLLGTSFANHAIDLFQMLEGGGLDVNPPPAAVADWPLVGERLFAAWTALSADLPAFVTQHQAQLRGLAKSGLSAAAGTAGSMLVLLGALIVAGIMMAYGRSGSDEMGRIIGRFVGPARGPRLHKLCTATIRSVAVGVVGVACIQALLMGCALLLADIPAAGIWALIVLVLAILQLPGLIVGLPAIAYLWSTGDGSMVANVLYSVLVLVASLADNLLKPFLLGRGVEAPMPVVLLGALGGMISAGIVGLFVGAAVLALGYVVFMEWVHLAPSGDQPAAANEGKKLSTGGE